MFKKTFLSGKICLILVTFQKIQGFLIRLIKSYWKNEWWIWWSYCRRICWIKVKDVFYEKIDDKEYNTAKGVSIGTEFNKFKDVLFNKKILRHKMRRIQSRKHKLGTYETDKIS